MASLVEHVITADQHVSEESQRKLFGKLIRSHRPTRLR